MSETKNVIIEQLHKEDKYGRIFRSILFYNKISMEALEEENKNRKVAIASLERGTRQLGEKKFDKAIDQFQAARKLIPSFGKAYVMEAIAMLINTGEFLGYLPAHYAEQWIEKDQMRPLLIDELSYRSQFILAYRGNESNIGAKKLIQHIEATFSTKKKPASANRRTSRG